jgi:hypothetical protein
LGVAQRGTASARRAPRSAWPSREREAEHRAQRVFVFNEKDRRRRVADRALAPGRSQPGARRLAGFIFDGQNLLCWAPFFTRLSSARRSAVAFDLRPLRGSSRFTKSVLSPLMRLWSASANMRDRRRRAPR